MYVQFKYLFVFLALVAVLIWLAVLTYPKPRLKLVACDVGQGDAILAVYGKTQILVDGGVGNKVLDCLSRHIPFWDRQIELVVLTHPQLDHFGGLVEVFERFNVQVFLANNLDSSSQEYQALKTTVGVTGVRVVNPTEDTFVRVGLMQLDILHPSKMRLAEKLAPDIDKEEDKVLGAFITKEDPNDFSIVAKLTFGEFDALLTGDIMSPAIDEILKGGEVEDVEYIKVPHHGSKNGLTDELLVASTPEIAVISAGRGNSYGHPHKEVLDMLSRHKLQVFRTDETGDVVIESDGKNFWVK